MAGPRRWHFWSCSFREEEAQAEIDYLRSKGYQAKIWAPRPEHKSSGHFHVVFLISREDFKEWLRGLIERKEPLRILDHNPYCPGAKIIGARTA